MMPFSPLKITFLFLLSSLSLATEPPPDFKFMVNFWGSDSCCGYGFGISVVRPGECIYVGASRPGGEGSSMQISSSPRSNTSYDPMSYGYGIGFSDAACTDKAFDIKTRGCFVAPDLQNTLRSFSFKLDPSMPMERRRVPGGISVNSTVVVSAPGDIDAVASQPRATCRALEWFQYMDPDLGRVRKAATSGSQETNRQVVELYHGGWWSKLQALKEYREF